MALTKAQLIEELKKAQDELKALQKKTEPEDKARAETQKIYIDLLQKEIDTLNKLSAATVEYSKDVQGLIEDIKKWTAAQGELEKLQAQSDNTGQNLLERVEARQKLEEKSLDLLNKQLEALKKYAPEDEKQKKAMEDTIAKLRIRTEAQSEVNSRAKGFAESLEFGNTRNSQFIQNIALSSTGLGGLRKAFFENINPVELLGKSLINLGVAILEKTVIASFYRTIEVNKLLANAMKENTVFIDKQVESFTKLASASMASNGAAQGLTSSLATLGVMQEQLIKSQVDLAVGSSVAREAFNTAGAAGNEYTLQLASTTAQLEKLGLGGAETAKLIDTFTISIGAANKNAESINKALTSFAESAQRIGVPLKKFAADFESSMASLAAQGNRAMDIFLGLEKRSKTLGVEFGTLLGIVGKYDTFEGAAEAAGSLNAILGGDYLNSIQMLNASEEERVDLMREALNASGQSFASMDKYQQKAIAASLGISNLNDANKLFSNQTSETSAEQKTFSEMMEKSTSISEKFENSIKKLATVFEPFMGILESLVNGFAKFTDIIAKDPTIAIVVGLTLLIGGFLLLKSTVMLGWEALTGLKKTMDTLPAALKQYTESAKQAAETQRDLNKAMQEAGDKGPAGAGAAPTSPEGAMDKIAAGGAGAVGDIAKSITEVPEEAPAKANAVKDFLVGLRDGLQEFGKEPRKTFEGAAVLLGVGLLMGVALGFLVKLLDVFGVDPSKMVMVGGSIYALAQAMKQVSETKIDKSKALEFTIAVGVVALGIAALGFALQQFKEIDLGTLGIVGLAIGGLAALVFGIASLISGPQAVIFETGLLVIGMLAGALLILGLALRPLAINLKTLKEATGPDMAKNLTQLGDSLTGLSNLLVNIDDASVVKLASMANSIKEFGDGVQKGAASIAAFTTGFEAFAVNVTAASQNLSLIAQNMSAFSDAVDKLSAKQDAILSIGATIQTAFSGIDLSGMLTLFGYAAAIDKISESLNNMPVDKLEQFNALKEAGESSTIFTQIAQVTPEQFNSATETLKAGAEYNKTAALLGAVDKTLSMVGDALTALTGKKEEATKEQTVQLVINGKEFGKLIAEFNPTLKSNAAMLNSGRTS